MSKSNNTNIGCGTILLPLLTVAFVVLKLVNVIDWSWVWVLAPTWIPVVILIFIVFGFALWTVFLARK